jgi:hypothetical protein
MIEKQSENIIYTVRECSLASYVTKDHVLHGCGP